MNEEMKYILPVRKRKRLDKKSFILWSIFLSLCFAIIISFLVIPFIGPLCCGIVPIGIVSIICALGQIIGTGYYIRKHKYAYGENYEWYQIINSVIYGIQNVLRVLLIVALFNICILPVFIVLIVIYAVYFLYKLFGR